MFGAAEGGPDGQSANGDGPETEHRAQDGGDEDGPNGIRGAPDDERANGHEPSDGDEATSANAYDEATADDEQWHADGADAAQLAAAAAATAIWARSDGDVAATALPADAGPGKRAVDVGECEHGQNQLAVLEQPRVVAGKLPGVALVGQRLVE